MPNTATDDLITWFRSARPYPLDPFQLEAMQVLARGDSVLVAAPTGSGKTVVAEFAIALALDQGRRCIYTTPLKALSNQKYRDLRDDLGEGKVGLLTGDIVIDPDAPVLVMTTEILRNMLQADPDRVADVAQVVLDEAHYLGAEGRGTVWEETIVFLGKHTSVTALSATIPNAEELATWVSQVHKPMRVVLHAERPVPLKAYVADPNLVPLFDAQGKLKLKAFGGEPGAGGQEAPRRTEARPAGRFGRPGGRSAHTGPGGGRERAWVDSPDPALVVKELKLKDLLPAIVFVFSRAGCESQAMATIRANLELTTGEEREEIARAVEEATRQTPGLLSSNFTKRWLELLPEGVAPHHAGLLPPFKFLIETLFQRALIKVVFATETLAAGINMPARTVVLSSLTKRTDDGHRMLTVGEFAQMTGRAGRRGMDEVGYGVVLASHRYTPGDVAHLVRDPVEPLLSRFTLNYNMVTNLSHRYEPDHARRIVEQCFSQFQNSAALARLVRQGQSVAERLEALDPECPVVPGQARTELLDAARLVKANWDSLRKRVQALEAQRSYLSRQSANGLLARSPLGSWLLVHPPGYPAPRLAVLISKHPTRSGDIQFGVALADPSAVLRLGGQHLVTVLDAPKVSVPASLVRRANGMAFLQQLPPGEALPWDRWLEASRLDVAAGVAPITDPPEIGRARAKLHEVGAQLEAHPCTTCRQRKKCQLVVKDRALLERTEAGLSREVEQIRGNHWRQFVALRSVLEELHFLRDRELLPRGVALAHLRTANELLSAEVVASGVLEGLAPAHLAAVVSGLVAEPVRGRQLWRPLRYAPQVDLVFDQVAKLGKHLAKVQAKHAIDDQPLHLVSDYAGLTQVWAEGAEWAQVTEASGIDEGQLVRHLRHVIDLVQQLREIPGVGATFHDVAREAIALLDRDIVKEVF